MGIQEKKVSTCVILSIVTLGIYALIWMRFIKARFIIMATKI